MQPNPELEARLAKIVEHHVAHGACPPVESVCEGREDLIEPLRALVAQYLALADAMAVGAGLQGGASSATTSSGQSEARSGPASISDLEQGVVPVLPGFRTVERLGRGGMGEVFKLHDLKLDRIVAGKIVRRDRQAARGVREFLAEARALALFQDRRIVQVHELRDDADPPVIVMEFVDGFELGQVASSLEYRQRARIVEEVADAIHRAHRLGIQHRDLKPSNIMLDAALSPKILDFGLSAGDPSRGHLRGTLPYVAPEQLDPTQPIDARADIYALGVILYEVLCGDVPFAGSDEAEIVDAIRRGRPRLPVEIEPGVPEPLQAIALKAMEVDPRARYQSAQEMAQDLRRYLDGRTVLARPAVYSSVLDERIRTHVEQIGEWLRLRLIYPHEAQQLRGAYHALEAHDDDWIVSARSMSYSQIALYLGAFLLMAGALFYFGAYRLEAFKGVVQPTLVLGLPFAALNGAGHYLYRKERRAVAVAFYLGGVALLPLFLMILLHETGIWVMPRHTAGQLFTDGYLSNRQLQATLLAACAWSCFLAFRTRTVALSTVFTGLLFLMALAVLSDLGLRGWLTADPPQIDELALHLAPLVAIYAVLGFAFERSRRPWFGRPLYVAAALTLVVVLEMLAWDRKEFEYLGITMTWVRGGGDIVLLDTLAAMTLNGVAMYGIALVVERRGSDVMKRAAGLLFTLSPFAALKPLGYLTSTGRYSLNFDWTYLGLSIGCCLLAHHRQRRSFYYAGVINLGWALWEITEHNHWRDKPVWAIALVMGGLGVLAIGYGLNARERNKREIPGR